MRNPIFARFLLLLPGWWYFNYGLDPGLKDWTYFGMVKASVLWFGFLWWWDSTRRPPRCPISVMLARLFIAAWILSVVVLWILPFKTPACDPFRYGPVLATILVFKIVFWALVAHTIGHFFIYPHDPTGNYYQVRAMGWHPFWDRLWPIFNPDPPFVRDGGIFEPEYTKFVPPDDWPYQCPSCGARNPYEVCVCWNCGYGADGDSTAYYERYGHIEPPPPPSHDGHSPPPEEPMGPYGPVKPR